jgi:hypothetical protein
MIPDPRREHRLAPNQTHGTKALKRAIQTLGKRALDQRTTVAKALVAWRSDLIADLGGPEAVSTQELALIDEAVKTKLILDSIDAWLLSQETLINKRAKAVLPAVRDRNALVTTLRALLTDLGLRRRVREAQDLGAYLADRYAKPANGQSEAVRTEPPCAQSARSSQSPSAAAAETGSFGGLAICPQTRGAGSAGRR